MSSTQENLISLAPLHDNVIVGIYDDGSTPINIGGKEFYTMSDDKLENAVDNVVVKERKHRGIRPRWGIVLASGDGPRRDGVYPMTTVLMEQMEWSRAVSYTDAKHGNIKVWKIPGDKIMMVSDLSMLTEHDKNRIRKLYPFIQF